MYTNTYVKKLYIQIKVKISQYQIQHFLAISKMTFWRHIFMHLSCVNNIKAKDVHGRNEQAIHVKLY